MKKATKKKAAKKTTSRAVSLAIESAPLEVSAETQVMNALVSQINSGTLAPEQLGMVLDAQERVLDRQSKQSFNVAMTRCQADMPSIIKDQYNTHTSSSYESLESLNKVISPVYTSHGFAVSFGTGDSPKENHIRVTAELIHRDGWSKDYQYDLPVDDKGIGGNANKTAVHGSASTLSYGRRYLLKMIFNLTTSDEHDDDGNAAGAVISTDQINTINDLIKEVKADKESFLKYCNIESIQLMPTDKYDQAIRALEAKK